MAGKDTSGSTRPMWFALGGYGVLLVGKLAAFALTHVGVLFAEAMHSLADVLIASFLLIAAYLSRRPADENFRFGYGRAQNIAALVAATIFISFTSFETLREAIPKLFSPAHETPTNLGLAIGVIVVSMLVSALPLMQLLRIRKRGAAQHAQLVESVNDVIALGAALIGTLLVAEGFVIADPIASCVVAIIIAINAGILWRENAATLMGQSPEDDFYDLVDATAFGVTGVLGTHGVIAEQVGQQIRLGMHIEVAPGLPIEEADRIADTVRAQLEAKVPGLYCVVHVDPSTAPRTGGA